MNSRPVSKRGASKAKKQSVMKVGGISGVPGWLWLVAGVTAGFCVAFLFQGSPGLVAGDKVAGKSAQVKTSTNPTPVFDFYTLLPESEVAVGEKEKPFVMATKSPTSDKATATIKKKSSATSSQGKSKETTARYLLQAGSFRSLKDADRLRAQLLLWGLKARVEKVSVGEGEYWHRVQVGPFDNQQALDSARKTLANNKVDTLLLKMK